MDALADKVAVTFCRDLPGKREVTPEKTSDIDFASSPTSSSLTALDGYFDWWTDPKSVTTNSFGDFATTQLRIGIGHDTHRLEEPGPLLLGGVEIPFDKHLVGHSDADVLLHAITDALLGAASLGDIGDLFPDTDEANCDRCSADMLAIAHGNVIEAGYQIGNLDCIVFAERPKLTVHKKTIEKRVSEILNIAIGQVNVKAKTGEGIGAVGTEQVISAQCIALIICAMPTRP